MILRPSQYINSCIACFKAREPGSGFCKKHREEHEASPWVKAWRIYQAQLSACKTAAERKQVYWVAPEKG